MGGRELAEKLTQKSHDLPVIYTSGYTDDSVVRHGVIEANTNFIQKPFTSQALTSKIREVLNNSSSQDVISTPHLKDVSATVKLLC